MPCTPKKTVEAVRNSGNTGIFQVKANQATLLADCQLVSRTEPPTGVFTEQIEKAHGRIETRTLTVWQDFIATEPDWQGLLTTLITVQRTRTCKNTKTKQWDTAEDTAFFLATHPLAPHHAARCIRGHWGIENKAHRVRDGAFAEDASRIRRHPTVFARLRSFALNACRAANLPNIAQALYENALHLPNALALVGIP